MKKISFHNLGCKVNTYELDAMAELFAKRGYQEVPWGEPADVCVINTCSVTNIADRKSRQMLSKARKQSPDAIVIAVGCYVQTREEELLKNEGIDLCIGNNKKGQIVEILEEFLNSRDNSQVIKEDAAVIVKDADMDKKYDDMSISKSTSHTRCFVKVQDGCNQFCSYCIIPFARGRVRSRKQEDVIAEIKKLVENGFKEFVITGIHLSSYGSDFVYEKQKADQFCPEKLLELLEAINDIEGVERIRLGSLEPRIVTDEFTARLSKIEKICPHFHLSLQSGSAATLKRMNRHYTKEEYLANCQILRKYFEHPAITTDVIVGFPGETEEEFIESRDFLKEVDFYETHIFKYSKRQGTVAATMPGQLTEKVKSERSDVLEELEKEMTRNFREYYIGKEEAVLFEEEKEIDGKTYMVGHTKEYVKVALEVGSENASTISANDILMINIEGFLADEYMLGRIL